MPSKRRKTESLNSRFDRMEDTVRLLHTERASLQQRRRRTSSVSGSSSTASYDIPRTPVDAYSSLDDGRVGLEFSTVKSQPHTKYARGAPLPSMDFMFGHGDHPTPNNKAQVPLWLQDTVASLKKSHPLRSFIPVPTIDAPEADPGHHVEEDVFAFQPPAPQQETDDMLRVPDPMQPSYMLPEPSNARSVLPFSMPGPGSDLAHAEWANTVDTAYDLTQEDPQYAHSHGPPEEDVHLSAIPPEQGETSPNRAPLPFAQPPSPTLVEDDFSAHIELSPQYLSSSPLTDSYMHDAQEPGLTPARTRSSSSRTSDSISFPKPFSTPGPGSTFSVSSASRAPTFKVFFDSPTEDPMMSDPMEKPDYELDLDYDNLDFKWEKFDRSAIGVSASSPSFRGRTGSDSDNDLEYADPLKRDLEAVDADVAANEALNRQVSPSLELFQPRPVSASVSQDQASASLEAQGEMEKNMSQETKHSEPTPDPTPIAPVPQPRPVAFAPTSDIYISPLRGSEESHSDEEKSPASPGKQQTQEQPDRDGLTNDTAGAKVMLIFVRRWT